MDKVTQRHGSARVSRVTRRQSAVSRRLGERAGVGGRGRGQGNGGRGEGRGQSDAVTQRNNVVSVCEFRFYFGVKKADGLFCFRRERGVAWRQRRFHGLISVFHARGRGGAGLGGARWGGRGESWPGIVRERL